MGRVIGLTGKYAAGKGTVAAYLGELGYAYHSLSDILREELAARGQAESRENLLALGNELRTQGGPGVLATRLSDRLQQGRHVVDSIRNPVEVEVLRHLPGFHLIGVDADPKVRFERLRARGRQGDPETFETFAALEARETHNNDPNAQRLADTWALIDEVVDNGADLPHLHAQVDRLLAQWGAS